MNECIGDHNRFEKAITKSKIVNFATESFVKKNKLKKANKIIIIITLFYFGKILQK